MSRKVTSIFAKFMGWWKCSWWRIKREKFSQAWALLCLSLFFGGFWRTISRYGKILRVYLENIQSPLPLLRASLVGCNPVILCTSSLILKAEYSHTFSLLAMSRELVLWKTADLWSSTYSLPQEKSYRRSRGCDLNMSKHLSPHQRRPSKILLSLQNSGSWGKSTAIKPPALTGASQSFSIREEIKDKPGLWFWRLFKVSQPMSIFYPFLVQPVVLEAIKLMH